MLASALRQPGYKHLFLHTKLMLTLTVAVVLGAFSGLAGAATDAASLLGIEGTAAREYFAGFAKLLKGGPAFNLEGRNRRPPRDR